MRLWKRFSRPFSGVPCHWQVKDPMVLRPCPGGKPGAGIVDPTKVTRSALENAASIGACVLTTESLVVDKPDPAADAAANAAAAAQGGMY